MAQEPVNPTLNPTADPAASPDARLDAFLEKMIGDLGGAISAPLVLLGDRLGLFKALHQAEGGLRSAELARKTGTAERNVREWLNAMAAAGYVDYDADSERYSLSPEQAMVFADPDSPVFMVGAIDIIAAMFKDEPRVAESFQSGRGFGWHEHDPGLFRGTERFFRPGYRANLVASWLPSLDGMMARLEAGASVADVGCGHGASTVMMAKRFPASRFVGFDYHPASIESARRAADDEGVGGRCRFEVAGAKDYSGEGYDLVTFFDCLHDMGDPVGAARHVRETLKPGGAMMIVEPMAHDCVADNLNPVGRLYYAASTMICTPASMSQEVGAALGAQAGEKRLAEILHEAGFASVRRAAETPFNMVLEARA